jgi:hypothetical protein
MRYITFKKIRFNLPIILLIFINIVLGLIIVRDYGQSWDEPGNYRYGIHSLANYYNLFHGLPVTDFNEFILDQKGPFYFMVAEEFSRLTTALIPSWSEINSWHFAYFISFQIAVLSLYFLCRKWMDTWAAFGATLLFSTQPIIWGHAFINPKDIPFMAFFLASITLGFYMVDSLSVFPIRVGEFRGINVSHMHDLKVDWSTATAKTKKIILSILSGFLLVTFLIAAGLLNRLIADLVTYYYGAGGHSLIGTWFARVAPNASQLPVRNYIHKAQAILFRFELVFFITSLLLGLWIFIIDFPLMARRITSWISSPFFKRIVINPLVLLAGITLGIVTSIRILGPFAGLMVILYGFYKCRRTSLLFLPFYFLVAVVTTYLTWPYLWGDPINRFIASLVTMSHYPWTGFTLFRGQLLSEKDLPKYFIPYTMSIQLTEAVLLLFIIGFAISVWDAIRRRRVEPFFLIIVWFLLPICGVIAINSTVYNGFRQFLFILPPVFLASGLALNDLFLKVRGAFYRVLILCLLVLPGIYADVRLHPYQYIYYNSLVGGTQGAFRNYELDYWGTSYDEAAKYINTVAPLGARVVVLGPLQVFQEYSRPDLILSAQSDIYPGAKYDYLVMNSHRNEDLTLCGNLKTVKTIERDGAILTAIKHLPPLDEECIHQPH